MTLLIPTRKPPAQNSFPTSPVDVAAWLDQLSPLLDNDSVRTLYRGLKHSNRLENNNRNRVEIMGILEPAIDEVLDRLVEQYLEQPLPLPRKPANAHLLASELLQEVAYAWKIVVSDTYATLLSGQAGLRNIAIFRALRGLAKIILHNALIHRPIPAGILHDANTLYKMAEESGMQDQTLELQQDDGARWTITHAYAHIQLLAMVNLQSQRSRQIPLISNLLDQVSENLVLKKPPKRPEYSPTTYAVHLEQDVQPSQWHNLQPQLRQHVRIFDIAGILQSIGRAAKAAPDALSREQESDTLNRRSLEVLGELLSRQNERGYQRRVAHKPVVTQLGIKEIYSDVRHLNATELLSPDQSAERWTILNESDSGLCLEWHSGSASDVQVGELITLRDQSTARDPHPGILGFVQWVNFQSAEQLLCGVQVINDQLENDVTAVLVEGLTETTRGSKIECICTDVSTDGNGPIKTILTPSHAYHESCAIRIHDDPRYAGEWIVRQKLLGSGAFDHYSLVPRTS